MIAPFLFAAALALPIEKPGYAVAVFSGTRSDPEWAAVADALVAKHAGGFDAYKVSGENLDAVAAELRARKPRYVAFVLSPEEAAFDNMTRIKRTMRSLDDDPFDDAVWAVVSGRTAKDALRVAKAGPIRPRSLLSTTGVDFAPFDNATTISDGYAAGHPPEEYSKPDKPMEIREKRGGGAVAKRIVRGDTTSVFADAWRDTDPQLIVTSAHASQRNLEMPFSTGNIVPENGGFSALPRKALIDYRTGQAKKDASKAAAAGPLAKPRVEKIWIACGNCLIGDFLGIDSMVATALSGGRCAQFFGYIATTWYGEIGWGTLYRFMGRGENACEAWYFSSQNMFRKLDATVPGSRSVSPVFTSARNYQRDLQSAIAPCARSLRGPDARLALGRLWDRDATAFYGDPALEAKLADGNAAAATSVVPCVKGLSVEVKALRDIPAGEDLDGDINKVQPFAAVLPRAAERRVESSPEGAKCFLADDFLLVTKWPAMKKGDTLRFVLSETPGN